MEPLTATQIRAARALIGWSQTDLAEATRLGVRTVKRVEGGERVTAAADFAIRTALEKAGVVFVSGVDDIAGKEVVAGVVLVARQKE